jgi:hypothetical protein
VSRNPQKEKILEAWCDLIEGDPGKRAEAYERRNKLVDEIASKSEGQLTREQILDSLYPDLKELRKQKRKAASIQVAQAAMKKS